MCGIAALFAPHLPPDALQALDAMMEVIRHRGPDGEGKEFFDAKGPTNKQEGCIAALGHRRLAIVDLSAWGKQPLSTSQRYWITYNGEIYNYIELRSILKGLGHTFTTQTDTEVILYAYQQWGVDCLQRFNGMFALVIYDCVEHKVFAARDRFGVKPLYFWHSPEGFLAMASEIKQFTVLPGWRPCLHGQGAYDYLNWGVLDHTHTTLFEGVQQIRGGEYLLFQLDQYTALQRRTWYTLSPLSFQGSFHEAAHSYVELLQDSVRLRLRADVPVGSCLSGGLDSSTLVCLMDKMLYETQKKLTFSSCSHHPHFDERDYIDHVVQHAHVEPHYAYPNFEELWTSMPTLIWHQDEPFGSSSIFAQWKVFELAKQKQITVIFDGQGADEQLAGYLGFFGNSFYDLFATGRWGKLTQEMQLASHFHPTLEPWGLLLNKLVPSILRQPLRKALGKTAAHPSWLNTQLLNAIRRDPFEQERHKSVYDQSRLQLLYSNLPMLLHYADRDSMAHSVESRNPFLDYRLVEFTLGLPNDYKIGQGWTKKLLREGTKGIVPDKIRMRIDKKAFALAEEEWVRQGGASHFRQAIAETIDLTQGILHPSARDLTEQMLSSVRPYHPCLWRWMCFGQWLKKFSVAI
jgi:asparagine synthase (glutamine-hydrolysing)